MSTTAATCAQREFPFEEGGTDPGNYATYDGDDGTQGTGSPYYRTVVGEWENSASPYGTFDQGGNVYEWNEEIIGTCRGFRGAAFSSDDSAGCFYIHAAERNDGNAPTEETNYLGFRAVRIP